MIEKSKANYQLVTPHSHDRNLAEWAVKTFKNYLRAELAYCDANLPPVEWNRLITQANLTDKSAMKYSH